MRREPVCQLKTCACGCGEEFRATRSYYRGLRKPGAGPYFPDYKVGHNPNTRAAAVKGGPGRPPIVITTALLEERWRAHVIPGAPDECWEWQGGRDAHNYGKLRIGRAHQELAHRRSYILHKGPLSPADVVRHSCDNPPCVNPAHLHSGTHLDNILDKIRKGRYRNQNTDKTHCPNGHEYTAANTYLCKRGKRSCQTCKMDACRRYAARKKRVAG